MLKKNYVNLGLTIATNNTIFLIIENFIVLLKQE